jgi:hypothetical protein
MRFKRLIDAALFSPHIYGERWAITRGALKQVGIKRELVPTNTGYRSAARQTAQPTNSEYQKNG